MGELAADPLFFEEISRPSPALVASLAYVSVEDIMEKLVSLPRNSPANGAMMKPPAPVLRVMVFEVAEVTLFDAVVGDGFKASDLSKV